MTREFDFAALFAAGVHEIKNELFLLLDQIDAMRQSSWATDEKAVRALSHLRSGGEHIGDRLTHMLALYRIEAGNYDPDISYNSLSELFEELVLEIESTAGKGEILLEVEMDQEYYAFFDHEIVRSILLNALHNAVRAGATRIVLSALRSAAEMTTLRVEDNGPGFPPELLGHGDIQPALRLSNGSTGLGLLFARQAAALHRNQGHSGKVSISNGGRLGGAVFDLTLP